MLWSRMFGVVRPSPSPRAENVHVAEVPAAPTPPTAAPAAPPSNGAAGVAVEEVSILDEVEIYLAYGHQEQAVTALRWYVEHHPSDFPQRERLRNLYLKLKDLDGLAEQLDADLTLGAITPESARTLVLEALDQDPSHLGLLVLAEERLHLGLDDLEAELRGRQPSHTGPSEPETEQLALSGLRSELGRVIDSPDSSNPGPTPFRNPFPREKSASAVVAEEYEGKALVRGNSPLSPLSDEEQQVVSTLVSVPRLTKLLLRCGQERAAEELLQRQIILHPKQLHFHVLLLQLLFHRQDLNAYGLALLRLYIALWGLGKALRQRLLEVGKHLGVHPLWTELAACEGAEEKLAPLAERYGLYLPLAAIPLSNPPLVEERLRRDGELSEAKSDDQVFREFNLLLDYGQVEEAVDLLENAALSTPHQRSYFAPLLEMYERMQARDRFTRFSKKILAGTQLPDESILRQMYHLSERLQEPKSVRA
ncbi:hypothetical protein [Candidatus Igneacidithiobacillus taiwanensis]|uniref:type IV pilus assembly protein FimV n=1 Tax=Candidatus Igneacidithiobacillus taiwanensis TaxID=1945924 RepID=UPI0028A16938|nr:hypothetical protein [Candidatus Igneacidithiobacillus taiwanensis]